MDYLKDGRMEIQMVGMTNQWKESMTIVKMVSWMVMKTEVMMVDEISFLKG